MLTDEEIQENLAFKSRRLLHFDGIDQNTPVHRVFPVDRLFQLFTEGKNTLVKPKLWDDPFENIVLQHGVVLPTGETAQFDEIREKYYGQCWTLNTQETDALWRIYSPNKNGVRVTTTLQKLWDTFYDPNHKLAMISYNMGKIQYGTEDELKAVFEDPDKLRSMIFESSGNGLVETLLVKRTAFEHENEVRLLYTGHSGNDDLRSNIYQYDFDVNSIIDEMLFDPRYDDALFQSMKKIIESLGYKKAIMKSKLYQPPNFNLRLNS